MRQIHVFAQEPLALLLKIRTIQNAAARGGAGDALFDGLNGCASQLELFCTQALSARSEREGVEALRGAYMKVASVKYYIDLLRLTGDIPRETAAELTAACDRIESRLQPLVSLNAGKFDDWTDEEFYEALRELWERYGDEAED